jgi:hypothetical protein
VRGRRAGRTVSDLIGRTAGEVLTALGALAGTTRGTIWPPPADARDGDGSIITGALSVQPDGESLNVHPFGPRQQKIQLGVLYEIWCYDVRGDAWYIYLTKGGVTASASPVAWASLPTHEERLPGWWDRVVRHRDVRRKVEVGLSPRGVVY